MKKLFYLVAVLAIVACAPVPVKPDSLPLATSTATAPSLPTLTPFPTSTPLLCLAARGNVNVRQDPKYNSPVLGWFSQGKQVELQSVASPEWWRVAGLGMNARGKKSVLVGYVRSSWITMEVCQDYVQTEYYIEGRSVYFR